VRVLTNSGPLNGVIGVKPGHVLSSEAARHVPPIGEMYIDVGAASREEAQAWGIEPGTPAVFVGPLTATRNPNRMFGKCVDNRMGVLAVLHVARRLAAQSLPATRAYAIVVEEEIGLRGAEVAARHLKPDVVIAIDTVPSGGTPDLRPDELPWEIGKGPLVKVRESKGLATHGPLRSLLREVAARERIPLQLIVDTAGITDATSAQQAGGQIAAAVVGLARRYAHSAVEMFDLADLQQIIDLVSHAVVEIRDRAQLMRL
jgi:endoglucanase